MGRWIIPDIHGCARTVKVLLENMLKVTRDDELFFLGDYIDRGPASKEVLDYLMDLQERGWKIHCLKGNHEDYCVKAWEEDQKWHLRHQTSSRDPSEVHRLDEEPRLLL